MGNSLGGSNVTPPDAAGFDWHPADVLASLKKQGLSLAGLSVANGYHPTAAGKALRRSWPAMELIIAAALNRTPREIWPTRYSEDGVPNRRLVT
jgi:Ner family transcriptional regulator